MSDLGNALVCVGVFSATFPVYFRFGSIARKITNAQMLGGIACSTTFVALGILRSKAIREARESREECRKEFNEKFLGAKDFKNSGGNRSEFIEKIRSSPSLSMVDLGNFFEVFEEEEEKEQVIRKLIQALAASSVEILYFLGSTEQAFLNAQTVKEALPNEHSQEFKKYQDLIRSYIDISWFEELSPKEFAIEILERLSNESSVSVAPNCTAKLEEAIEEVKKILPPPENIPPLRRQPTVFSRNKPRLTVRRAFEIGSIVTGVLFSIAAFYAGKQKQSRPLMLASIGGDLLALGGALSWGMTNSKRCDLTPPLERVVQQLPHINPADAAKIRGNIFISMLEGYLRTHDNNKNGARRLEDLLLLIRSCPNLRNIHLNHVFSLAEGVPEDEVVRRVVQAVVDASVKSLTVSSIFEEKIFRNAGEMKRILGNELFEKYEKIDVVFDYPEWEAASPGQIAVEVLTCLKDNRPSRSYECFIPKLGPAIEFLKSLYPNNLKNWDLERVKAPGIDDFNQPNITNIEQVEIVEPRELSRSSKTNSSGYLGINAN
ncbi:MAG: hypothetical protein JSR80_06595 [Verrucomicrobia bacterium]|nr:hypothetical protein [Verrucomicrobiota bacterium]